MILKIRVVNWIFEVQLGSAFTTLESYDPGKNNMISKQIPVPTDWWGASHKKIESSRWFSIRKPDDGAVAFRAFSKAIRFGFNRANHARRGACDPCPGVNALLRWDKKSFSMEFWPVNWRKPNTIKLSLLGIAYGTKYIVGPLAIQWSSAINRDKEQPPVISDDQFKASLALIAADKDESGEQEDLAARGCVESQQ